MLHFTRESTAHLERTRLYAPFGSATPSSSVAVVTLSPARKKSSSADEKEKQNGALVLLDQKPLSHPTLLQYLEKRRIDLKLARKYFSQIDFKAPQSSSSYFALGYPSGDDCEARNALFKGFVGSRKDITFHSKPDSTLLLIFEGFIDFLTYLTVKGLRELPGSVLVLNSGSLKARAMPHIQDDRYTDIQLFLDNDDMGNETVQYFLENTSADRLTDMREHYAPHSDLNARHMVQGL